MLKLSIGGITPFSTIDYPNRLSAVFFFQGCPFRCPYCHNSEFQEVKRGDYPFEEFASFLEERNGFLDAVVFSGGEPLLFPKEVETMSRFAKEQGYLTGLHTTGYNPENLKRLLEENLIDWVGIDLKSHREFYPEASGVEKNFFPQVVQSMELLKKHKIDFEVRTTVYEKIANEESLKKLFNEYKILEIEQPVIQIFSEKGFVDFKIREVVKNFMKKNSISAIIRG